MLQSIRDKSQGWLAWVVVLLIVQHLVCGAYIAILQAALPIMLLQK